MLSTGMGIMVHESFGLVLLVAFAFDLLQGWRQRSVAGHTKRLLGTVHMALVRGSSDRESSLATLRDAATDPSLDGEDILSTELRHYIHSTSDLGFVNEESRRRVLDLVHEKLAKPPPPLFPITSSLFRLIKDVRGAAK